MLATAVTGCALALCACPPAHPSGSSAVPASDSATRVAETSAHPSAVAPTRAQIARAIARLAHKNSAGVTIAKVIDISQAQDSRGRWWASATAVPADRGRYDDVTAYVYLDGSAWKLFDLGTGIELTELLADVRDKL